MKAYMRFTKKLKCVFVSFYKKAEKKLLFIEFSKNKLFFTLEIFFDKFKNNFFQLFFKN